MDYARPRDPPFSVQVLYPDGVPPPPLESLLPAVVRDETLPALAVPSLTPAYLAAELGLGSLDDFHHWFWLLGSPALPRPLHDSMRQARTICVTERLDRHLTLGLGAGPTGASSTRQSLLFVKPLPRLLLDLRFWKVLGLEDRGISLGFLYSYVALVPYESDFRIAQHHGLLPAALSWDGWRQLARQVATAPDVRAGCFHARFRYGELHLHRLRELTQLRRGGLVPVLAGRLDRLARFFHHNVRWLASLVAYLAIVLAAVQTGLATSRLADDASFQAFAAGFTVFALVAPLAVLVACGLYFGLALLRHIGVHYLASLWAGEPGEPREPKSEA